jgi:transcriptional regulator with XRE-family HTH domain
VSDPRVSQARGLRLLGISIRRLREERGLSQTSLAAFMRVSKSYVCDVEDGRRTITAIRIRQVAEFLGVSPDPFLRLRGFCAHCDGTGFSKETS